MTVRILRGDCRDVLKTLPDESVHCVVTSPPYWGLRDYGHAGQIGLESSPQAFVEQLVDVFREVHRVLRADGTLWLNLGDCYATGAGRVGDHPGGGEQGARWRGETTRHRDEKRREWAGRPPRGVTSQAGYRGSREGAAGKHEYAGVGPMTQPNRMPIEGLKPKDLVGAPWRVAFALQAAGWYLRQDIIWAQPNPMPESVRDRCTKSHEYLFLFSKSERYYFDSEAIAEPVSGSTITRMSQPSLDQQRGSDRVPGKTNGPMKAVLKRSGNKERKPASARGVPVDTDGKSAGAVAGSIPWEGTTRNKRSVWTVTTQPFKEAHFATFPPALIEPCVLAGSPRGGVVLDPFGGAGTTGLVADRHGRDAVLIELNPQYADMAERRITGDSPLFSEVAA